MMSTWVGSRARPLMRLTALCRAHIRTVRRVHEQRHESTADGHQCSAATGMPPSAVRQSGYNGPDRDQNGLEYYTVTTSDKLVLQPWHSLR